MKKEKNKLFFDEEKVGEAIAYIKREFYNSKYYTSLSQETITNINNLVQTVIDSVNTQMVLVDEQETEEEARQYFGKEFIDRFEELKKLAQESNVTIYIHGTNPEVIENIKNKGLMYKSPSITATAIDANTIKEQYTTLLNWPHHEYKGFVLIGVPNECVGARNDRVDTIKAKPLWKQLSNNNQGYKQFIIKPEFIMGYMDADKKQLEVNGEFSVQHNYDGLIQDTELTRILLEEDELQPEENGLDRKRELPSDTETLSRRLETEIEEIYRILNGMQLCANSGILEEKGSPWIEYLKEGQSIMKEAIPSLETVQEIESRIDKKTIDEERRWKEEQKEQGKIQPTEFDDNDFWEEEIKNEISDVTLQDINDTTIETKNEEPEKSTNDLEW